MIRTTERLRIAPVNFPQQLQAIAVGKADVEQQQIVGMLFQLGEAGFAGLRAGDAVAFAGEQEFEAFADF